MNFETLLEDSHKALTKSCRKELNARLKRNAINSCKFLPNRRGELKRAPPRRAPTEATLNPQDH